MLNTYVSLIHTDDFKLINEEGMGEQENRKPPLDLHSNNQQTCPTDYSQWDECEKKQDMFKVLKYLPENKLITKRKIVKLYSEESLANTTLTEWSRLMSQVTSHGNIVSALK